MNLDGISLSVLTKEIREAILGGQIQRLVQIDKTTLLIRINTLEGNRNLVITVGQTPSCYLAHELMQLPKEPTGLVMFLRKHLEGARITTVEQINGDRIIRLAADTLSLDGTLQEYEIFIELMGKYSNCIVVHEGVVLESLIHVTPLMNRVRAVAPKLTYELPPNSNRVDLMDFSLKEIHSLLESFGQDTVGDTIRHVFNGFGPVLMNQLLHMVGSDAKASFDKSNPTEVTNLATGLYQLKESILASTGIYDYRTVTNKRLITPIPMADGIYDIVKEEHYDTISAGIEADVKAQGSIGTDHKELLKLVAQAIKKERTRHEKIQAELDDTALMDTYKHYGDLLMIYSYMQVGYDKEITVDNVLVEPVAPITIPLTPGQSVVENAQAYYKLYTKLKNRTKSGEYQLEQSTRRIDYLESIHYSLELAKTKEELQEIRVECEGAGLIKKSKKPLPFKVKKDNFLHFSIPGGEVYIGRNNQQNDYLTHRWAKPNDLWLHTQNLQGSHVVLKSDVEPDIKMIEAAAQYAAYFSKGRDTSKVTVDYTPIKYIKKPPGSAPGYVIFSTHQDLVVEPKCPEGYEE